MKTESKSAICPMSTLSIDFQSLHRMWIVQGYQIAIYQLPEVRAVEGKKPRAGYARIQNWLKESVSGSYYYHQWGRKLFCLLGTEGSAQTLLLDEEKLVPTMLDAKEVSRAYQESFLNLMLAEYMQTHGKFVSNERYFIFVEPIQRKQYAVAMSLQIRRSQSAFPNARSSHHFSIVSRVMRFRRVTKEEYKDKWKTKKVPYALDFSSETTARLRQLRTKEVGAHEGDLYILKSNRKNKVSVPFLSLKDKRDFLQSRVGLVGQFIQDFVGYLQEKGLDTRQGKLDYRSIALPENRLQQLMNGFQFQTLDCRERREVPLQDITSRLPLAWLQNVPVHDHESSLAPNVPVLLWMDAEPSYYENVVGATSSHCDPYKRFKAQYPGVASQGFNANGNEHAAQAGESFENGQNRTTNQLRKVEIALRQLLLKQIILHPEKVPTNGLLPTSLRNKVFLSYVPLKDEKQLGRFITFAMEGVFPRLREFSSCIELRSYIQEITGNVKIEEQWEKMCPSDSGLNSSQITAGHALEPYVSMWRRLKAVVFDERGILKIELPGEYALYDYQRILDRLSAREEMRPVADFLPKGNTETHRKLEDFFEEKITDRKISYVELKKRYMKGENGFLEQVFAQKKETPYLQLLKKSNGLDIPGIKAKPLYDIHTGAWYNDVERKYFVGKNGTLKNYGQPYGFPIRWLHVQYGFRFDEHEFFEWFDTEFVREKEMTVLPLPFTLIRMKKDMTS